MQLTSVRFFEYGKREADGLERLEQAISAAELMCRLVIVMQTDDSAVPQAACDSALADRFVTMEPNGTRGGLPDESGRSS